MLAYAWGKDYLYWTLVKSYSAVQCQWYSVRDFAVKYIFLYVSSMVIISLWPVCLLKLCSLCLGCVMSREVTVPACCYAAADLSCIQRELEYSYYFMHFRFYHHGLSVVIANCCTVYMVRHYIIDIKSNVFFNFIYGY